MAETRATTRTTRFWYRLAWFLGPKLKRLGQKLREDSGPCWTTTRATAQVALVAGPPLNLVTSK